MANPRWHRINTIFEEALKLPPGEREDYLNQACEGDTSLQSEVAALLSADEDLKARSFLQSPPLHVPARPAAASDADPLIEQHLGPYRICKRIGKGGMGNVYLAVRTEGYQQQVAVKVLKRGMDSEEILRRFRTEIRVQAALGKHPHIAGILDAGMTADGLPYFIMEYVEGEPIDRYCDRHRLTVRQRLELFRIVCAAVQFAHQHTVVHRDLKPSNILVATDGTPKLIDFGIAKLTMPELGPETVTPTRTEMRLLTPEYASPEQVRGESITTASDVYSLGIVLYELLAGQPPYRVRNFVEMPRVVCEYEPERLSTMVSRQETVSTSESEPKTITPQSVARLRQTQLGELRRSLRGDLDNIVLKALEKEPARRYVSVEQFSADLLGYLEGRPVSARPVGGLEHLWRGCQRQPLAASLLASVLLGSVVGVAYLSHISNELVRSTALRAAAQQAQVVQHVQDVYSAEIKRLEDQAVEPEFVGRLTVPARFAQRFAESLGHPKTPQATRAADDSPEPDDAESEVVKRVFEDSVMYARLYSDYPFLKPGSGEAPPVEMNDFERKALDFVTRNPDPGYYYSFDEHYEGRPALRYVQARIMLSSCVDCHNEHTRSPKQDWAVGDVRGAVEISRPLEGDIARVREALRGTYILMGAVAAGMLALSTAVLFVGRKRRRF